MTLRQRVAQYVAECNVPLTGDMKHPNGAHYTLRMLKSMISDFGKEEVYAEIDAQFAPDPEEYFLARFPFGGGR